METLKEMRFLELINETAAMQEIFSLSLAGAYNCMNISQKHYKYLTADELNFLKETQLFFENMRNKYCVSKIFDKIQKIQKENI